MKLPSLGQSLGIGPVGSSVRAERIVGRGGTQPFRGQPLKLCRKEPRGSAPEKLEANPEVPSTKQAAGAAVQRTPLLGEVVGQMLLPRVSSQVLPYIALPTGAAAAAAASGPAVVVAFAAVPAVSHPLLLEKTRKKPEKRRLGVLPIRVDVGGVPVTVELLLVVHLGYGGFRQQAVAGRQQLVYCLPRHGEISIDILICKGVPFYAP